MKYPWAYPGAKVVCVNPDALRWWGGDAPALDAIYTVVAVGPSPIEDHRLAVWLAEITNVVRRQGSIIVHPNAGYSVERFAPVLPDTTKQVEAISQLVRDAMGKTPEGVA